MSPFESLYTQEPAAARHLASAFAVTHGDGDDAFAQLCSILRFHWRMHWSSEHPGSRRPRDYDLAGYLNGYHFADYQREAYGELDLSRMSELRELAQTFLEAAGESTDRAATLRGAQGGSK